MLLLNVIEQTFEINWRKDNQRMRTKYDDEVITFLFIKKRRNIFTFGKQTGK